tara:strand:- start:705 stop:1466 length:762 start_codon:yes stop_codon:yes gene_type:complete
MKVSIITLTYNSIKTIAKTIDSITNQNYRNIEKIWIDNCSTDGTIEYLNKKKDDKTKFVYEKDKGICFAFNKGLSLATGDIVGFLHSDDTLKTSSDISLIVETFEQNQINMTYSDLEYINSNQKVIRFWKADTNHNIVKDKSYFKKKIKYGWMPPHPTTYFEKSFLNKIKEYNTSYQISFDYDYLLRALKHENIRAFYIPKVLVQMKIGGNSNKSIKNILIKMLEDLTIIKKNNEGGLFTLLLKNLIKIKQFF